MCTLCLALADAGHAADLARQAAHLSSVTRAVADESKVNRELAGLLVERLEASKRCAACCPDALPPPLPGSTRTQHTGTVAVLSFRQPCTGGVLACVLGLWPAGVAQGHLALSTCSLPAYYCLGRRTSIHTSRFGGTLEQPTCPYA